MAIKTEMVWGSFALTRVHPPRLQIFRSSGGIRPHAWSSQDRASCRAGTGLNPETAKLYETRRPYRTAAVVRHASNRILSTIVHVSIYANHAAHHLGPRAYSALYCIGPPAVPVCQSAQYGCICQEGQHVSGLSGNSPHQTDSTYGSDGAGGTIKRQMEFDRNGYVECVQARCNN